MMETMALATMIYAGMTLVTAQPIPMQQCEALKAQHADMLCVAIEPDCGKGTSNRCLGRADLDEKPAVKAKPKKKRIATARRSSSQRYARR